MFATIAKQNHIGDTDLTLQRHIEVETSVISGEGLILPSDKTVTRRRQLLFEILKMVQKNQGPVAHEELVEHLLYAPFRQQRYRTLRMDLASWMHDEKNTLICSFSETGPVVAWPLVPYDTRFLDDAHKHLQEKQAIAQHVLGYLHNTQHLVFLDSGTTVFHIALALGGSSPNHNLNVITNNLYILPLLMGKVDQLRILGGVVDSQKASVVQRPLTGNLSDSDEIDTEATYERIDGGIISVTGISSDTGIYCESRLVNDKYHVVRVAQETIIFVADHSKIGTASGSPFVTFPALDALKRREVNVSIVTDDNLARCEHCAGRKSIFDEEIMKLRKAGIDVIHAPIDMELKSI